jgi:hypothetical protein
MLSFNFSIKSIIITMFTIKKNVYRTWDATLIREFLLLLPSDPHKLGFNINIHPGLG